MSDKGAVKKTIERKSEKVKTRTSSQSRNNKVDENTEKKKVSTERKSKTSTSLNSKNVLPDKNPVKLKQLKQNGLSNSRSSFDESQTTPNSTRKQTSTKESSTIPKNKVSSKVKSESNTKSNLKETPSRSKTESSLNTITKPVLSKTKSETTLKSTATERTKSNHSQRSVKEKHQTSYNEKRGVSSVYIPKDSASKLKSTIHSLDKKSRDSTSSTKNSEKVTTKHASRERRRSRTLSPSEVKVLQHPGNTSKSKTSKKAPIEAVHKAVVESDYEEEYDYEEDFEDYESDFQECSVSSQIAEESDNSILSIDLEPIVLRSEEKKRTIDSAVLRRTEEERMLDSGHFELSEAKKRAAMIDLLLGDRTKSPPIDDKKASSQSFGDEKQIENKSLPSSTDEGFEDSRSGDFVKSPPVSQVTLMNREKPKQEKIIEEPPKILTRGQILMKMIKLDTVEWSMYESKPISYDEFIRSYGKLNTQQTSTQTNDDNSDVEIQTDISEVENKWTQYPVVCRNNLKTVEDVRLFKLEHLGVGGDNPNKISSVNPVYDALKLNEFLSRAGKVMLALLEEKELGGNVLQNETHEFPFSEGFIKLSVSSISFLCGRQVTMLHYSETSNKILLSIHASSNEKIEHSSKGEYIMDCCIGCVWNVNEPSKPIKMLYSQNPITACCFHCTNNSIIFAGLKDGSICLWDLREEETWHQKVIDKVHEMDWIVRSPTYTTAGNWEIEAHSSSIVALRILSKVEQDDPIPFDDKFISIQICSLDENGRLIIWSVLRNLSHNSDDLGLTQWGKVRLVKSQEVPLFAKRVESKYVKKEFVDMEVDNVDRNNLYLASNDTSILHANCIGGRIDTLYYKINELDTCGGTTCLEVCPFKQSYFFAGCKDGSIRLHSSNVETPLLKLKDEDSPAGIKSIQWSKSKPLTIYILDDHSRIVVWDLKNSDICPTHTVSTKSWGNVRCMKLSPCNNNRDMQNQYLALGTDTGNLEVHKLKKNLYYSQQDDFLQEMDTFLRYVSIL